jgi:hypothetical protein
MKKVLILITAVLLTTAVYASDQTASGGPKSGTITADVLCTPTFDITVPGDGINDVLIGNFFPDGIQHTITAPVDKRIVWTLKGPAKKSNGNWIPYTVSLDGDNTNYSDADGLVMINTTWQITSHNINVQFYNMSGFNLYKNLQLIEVNSGNCQNYLTYEIIAYNILAQTTAVPGIKRFQTTLVVSVSI